MHDEENAYQSWLWGEILLFGLLGATLALFVTYPGLRPTYDLPQVRLVLDTMVALAAVLVAVLAGVRFSVDGRRLDWLLCAGFSLVAGSTFCFGIAPILGGQPLHRTEQWSWIWGRVLAGVLIAAAAFARRRTAARRRELFELLVFVPAILILIWMFADSFGDALPSLTATDRTQPPLLTATLALRALASLAAAAQQEARFAILALSSASGTAPFDAALRRYVDFLTADGQLEVDLEIDKDVQLAPDEQIEVFRIVQEGLANARKHADARHADVRIALRGDERVVTIVDDGSGFDDDAVSAGQGLRNMKARSASLGGAVVAQERFRRERRTGSKATATADRGQAPELALCDEVRPNVARDRGGQPAEGRARQMPPHRQRELDPLLIERVQRHLVGHPRLAPRAPRVDRAREINLGLHERSGKDSRLFRDRRIRIGSGLSRGRRQARSDESESPAGEASPHLREASYIDQTISDARPLAQIESCLAVMRL